MVNPGVITALSDLRAKQVNLDLVATLRAYPPNGKPFIEEIVFDLYQAMSSNSDDQITGLVDRRLTDAHNAISLRPSVRETTREIIHG